MGRTLSVNALAAVVARGMIERQAELGIRTETVAGATLVDCGIKCEGGWQAGLLFSKVCLGGLGEVGLSWLDFGPHRLPVVQVATDFPREACMASQYAGWFLKAEDYQAMGSGPARAKMHTEEIFDKIGYVDDKSAEAVLCLETDKYPTEAAVRLVAEKCGLPAEKIIILAAPTASPAGLLQIAARSVETGLHKMAELGFDLHKVKGGLGVVPLPPASKNDFKAMGRTNDAILYGATVSYRVEDEDAALAELAAKLPSQNSKDFGKLFSELWEQYGNFYDIDPMLFSPAEVFLHSEKTGHSFHAGAPRPDILARSFGLEG